MTEMEQLEHNTKVAKANQVMDELSAYMGELSAEIEELFKRSNKWWKYEIVIFLMYVGLMIAGMEELKELAWTLWFTVVLGNTYLVRMPLVKAFGEYDGVIKTLMILGMLPPRDDSSGRSRKKHKESFVAKMWEAMKRKKMEEAIA